MFVEGLSVPSARAAANIKIPKSSGRLLLLHTLMIILCSCLIFLFIIRFIFHILLVLYGHEI